MAIILVSFSELLSTIGEYNPFRKKKIDEFQKRFDKWQPIKKKVEVIDPGNFDLASLPKSVVNRIVDKLDFPEYVNFEETSKFAANLYKQVNLFPITKDVERINVTKKQVNIGMTGLIYERFVYARNIPWVVATKSKVKLQSNYLMINHWISSSRMKKITKMFKENETKIEKGIIFHQRILFNPEDLEQLVKVTEANFLKFRQFVPVQFFRQQLFDQVEQIMIDDNCGLTDKEFLAINYCPYFSCRNDFITAKGLNAFLKQWKRGERDFVSFVIGFDTSYNTRSFDIIIEGLNANPIWTPEYHEDSLVGKLPIEEFIPMESGDPEHLYAIWKSDNIDDILILELSMGAFAVYKSRRPQSEIWNCLNNFQYFDLTGKCYFCDEITCVHRRKYSVGKFRKRFPKIWRNFMFSVNAAKWITTLFEYSRLIFNSFWIVNRQKIEDHRRRLHYENPQNGRIHRSWIDFEFLVFNS